jgi:hypothetical protein
MTALLDRSEVVIAQLISDIAVLQNRTTIDEDFNRGCTDLQRVVIPNDKICVVTRANISDLMILLYRTSRIEVSD